MASDYSPLILVLATSSCAYPGADEVGKAHLEYSPNIHVVRVPSPVLFPTDFYLRCYMRGVDGILIASCGSDCPYTSAYEKLAKRIDALTTLMKEGGLEMERVRLTAICTVCIKAFLKEVGQMEEQLRPLGPVDRAKAEALWEKAIKELEEQAHTKAA
ncbi:MAG: hydrogenase iron-sulfur subunit [Verrucomicrobia bacterium]|nr:hydrogenase iron-sulfur subunit [Verrucomicrobiota bacterium]